MGGKGRGGGAGSVQLQDVVDDQGAIADASWCSKLVHDKSRSIRRDIHSLEEHSKI